MRNVLKALRSLCMILPIVVTTTVVAQGGTPDVLAMCNDLSPANRAMAKTAGYDVDALCAGFSQQPKMAPVNPQAAAIPQRQTVAAEKIADQVAPTAVVGVTAPPPIRSLKPFGYDLFAGSPNTFAPVTNVPVSPDYLLGPGDTLQVLFYGKTNSAFALEINRDGTVNFPELGPVGLAGLTFQEAKDMLQTRIATQMIGVQASISMGELRSMQIFVLGEAYKPGAYTVSSLSTITHALVVSGGVSDIASLRNIQLKRAGKVVATLDLYDLLMQGDTQSDIRLQPSDVIFVPTVGDLVSVDGQVLRPAIYELTGGESVSDLLALAGGLGPKAHRASARIERIQGSGFLTVVDLDLTQASDQKLKLRAGDGLRVDAIKDRMADIVSVKGHVYYPGSFAWQKGMRLSDLITSLDQFPPGLDLDYGIISREDPISGDLSALQINPGTVIAAPGGAEDLLLHSRDEILLFAQMSGRAAQLDPLLDVIKAQTGFSEPAQIVSINGTVQFPDEYPLTQGMGVMALINAAGGLTEAAYTGLIEIARRDLSDPQQAKVTIELASLSVLMGAGANDFPLRPNDVVSVKALPEYRDVDMVTLEGEVVFPGEYKIVRGETLTSVIERAGGLTDRAFIGGAFFSRVELREQEAKALEDLRKRVADELAAEQLQDMNSGIAIDANSAAIQRQTLAKLSEVNASGRLVVSLDDLMAGLVDDIILKDGDRLVIPEFTQEVTVIGEVQRSASHLFDRRLALNDYLDLSGGFNSNADKRGIYLIKADGQVVIPRRKGLLKFLPKIANIEAGDTIIVPLDADQTKIRGISLISEVSKIVYELALGAAAVNSLGSP